MNNVYLKGIGDSEPPCTPDFTDEQIIRATKENAAEVAQNILDSFSMQMKSAIIEAIKTDDGKIIFDVINESVKDLMFREVIG